MSERSITRGSVVFKEIPDFPGYYADSEGNIWSTWKSGRQKHRVKGIFHKMKPQNGGSNREYYVVNLRSKIRKPMTRYVHSLVLITFNGPRPEGLQVCHWPDTNTHNNRPENLSWGTAKKNAEQKILAGCHQLGETNQSAKLKEAYRKNIEKLRKDGFSFNKIGKVYGVSANTILKFLRGDTYRKPPK